MKPEGGDDPVTQGGDGGLVACEKPLEIPMRWAEAMRPLPSQVLRPFRKARNRNLTKRTRRHAFSQATYQLKLFADGRKITDESVDDRMESHGIENVDVSNTLQADEFAKGLGTTRDALEKRQLFAAAIGAARLELARLEAELADGD